jgi:hypothetical protein
VRLSSLSGFTGAFQKMGLTGLPLATVTLTLIFAGLAIYDKQSFLDLAKLTLGAFIGSFVQKQQVDRGIPNAGTPAAGQTGTPATTPLPV